MKHIWNACRRHPGTNDSMAKKADVDARMPRLRTAALAAAFVVAASLTAPVIGQAGLRWGRVAASTAFCPRDSSPNGVLFFRNAFWILEGYRYQEDASYVSSSDVWRSIDGRRWTLQNSNPPYYPYSSYVAFKGYMWAFSDATPEAFRSRDGRYWEQLDPPPFVALRGTVFHDQLWILDQEQCVWSSSDGLAWRLVLENAPWSWRAWPGWVVMKNRLWLIGGGIYNYIFDIHVYFNDVWSSPDGEHWTLVTSAAPWAGRYWFGCAAYDGKLWVIGGFRDDDYSMNDYGNRNDVWFSTDGAEWRKQQRVPWSPRHAMFHWVAKDSLWISSGYSGGGRSELHHDVWRLHR